jgi:hypothetical protein
MIDLEVVKTWVSWFVGTSSPFQVVTGLLASTAIVTVAQKLFGRARLRIKLGPWAELIGTGKNRDTARLRIVGTFSNTGSKLGVVDDMSAVAVDEYGTPHKFLWVGNLDPAAATRPAEEPSVAAPITVPAYGAQQFCIELLHDCHECADAWFLGLYEISLRARFAGSRQASAAFSASIGEVLELVLGGAEVPRRWVKTEPRLGVLARLRRKARWVRIRASHWAMRLRRYRRQLLAARGN